MSKKTLLIAAFLVGVQLFSTIYAKMHQHPGAKVSAFVVSKADSNK
jgi:hypothetical protein